MSPAQGRLVKIGRGQRITRGEGSEAQKAKESAKEVASMSEKLKVKTYCINRGQPAQYYGLKTAKENTVLHSAPNNWKTERGAYGWAKKHGYEVPKSVEKAPKAKSKAKGKPEKKKQK